MDLNEFLTKIINETEDKPAAKLIPISDRDNLKGTSLVSKIENSLQNSNLNNIELDSKQNDKAYASKNKTRVYSNAKLKLHCKKHKNEISNKSVKELNAMITGYNQGKKTGTLNPCSIANKLNKEGKLESELENNETSSNELDKQNPNDDSKKIEPKLNQEISEDGFPKKIKKYGSFDSKEEVLTYLVLNKCIENTPILKGCKVWPLEKGYGRKFHFTDINNESRDADIYLEYTPDISAVFNGKKGLAFLVDGSTHYAINVKNAVFSADEERNHSNENHITRKNVYDIDDKLTGKKERRDIIKWVEDTISNLIEHIPHDGEKLKSPEKAVRAYGEKKAGNVLRREQKKLLNQDMLGRLIRNLSNRESGNIPPFHDLEDNYHSDKYGDMKLSTFLTPNNKKSGYKGKISYERYPHIWKQIVSAPKEKLHDWKEKHQAKNGERLFSGNSDEDRKLFEDKN